MKRSLVTFLIFALIAIGLTGLSVSTAFAAPQAYCQGRTYPIDCWVREPEVRRNVSQYPQIQFLPGDHIYIDAGGCVQTGGAGKIWKRYVNPASDNDLYHGLIYIPSVTRGLVRLQEVVRRSFTVGEATHLWLGYEDDNYSDNGYWGHDNGTGNQCRNVGPAWVHIVITR